jgi:inositol-pentakisphosphate 2-kinase
VNLIRKILLKDFSRCDSEIDFYGNEITIDRNDVHFRNCTEDSFPQLPKNCILRSILKAQHLVRDKFSQMESFESSLDERMENYEQIIQDYRMGSTALDCSVMVTFRRINEVNFDVEQNDLLRFDKNHYVTFNGFAQQQQHFIVKGTIVDLDEKKDSFAHFHKYKKQYRESVVAYENFMKEKHLLES